jgi:hypothetical protein
MEQNGFANETLAKYRSIVNIQSSLREEQVCSICRYFKDGKADAALAAVLQILKK